jgi:DNA polymerase III epsilon subunit-like protein
MAELVYFDLETTGLIATDPDILQIGAITSDCSDSFDKFIKPETRETTPEVEAVNNLKYDSKT